MENNDNIDKKMFDKKEYMKQYSKEKIYCELCDVYYARYNKDHHIKTQKHNNKKMIIEYNKKINDLEKKVEQIKELL